MINEYKFVRWILINKMKNLKRRYQKVGWLPKLNQRAFAAVRNKLDYKHHYICAIECIQVLFLGEVIALNDCNFSAQK